MNTLLTRPALLRIIGIALLLRGTTIVQATPFPQAGIDQFESSGIFILYPDGSPVAFMFDALYDPNTKIGRSDPFVIGSGSNPPIDTGSTGLPNTPNPSDFAYPGDIPPYKMYFPLPTDGRRAINTEMLSFNLTQQFYVPDNSYAPVFSAGFHTLELLAGLPFQEWTEGPGQGYGIAFTPSFGQVVSNDFSANPDNDLTNTTDSFFDVFLVALLDGQPLYNSTAFLLGNSCTRNLPPTPADDPYCNNDPSEPGKGTEYEEGEDRLSGQSGDNYTGYGAHQSVARIADDLKEKEKTKFNDRYPDVPIVTFVPEPDTFALFGAGAFVFSLFNLRRKPA